jgi:hypothetical protein
MPKCFQTEERNVNPDYINLPGAHDLDYDIRACYPRDARSRNIIVVLSTGETFKLDAAGNAAAAKLVEAAGKPAKRQHYFPVEVIGRIVKDRLEVQSIAATSPQ